MTVDLELIRALPKVSLHDHLDGGLRPQTIIELAAEVDHELPAETADDLGRWFRESADSGSLVRYLETFDHTIAVMQTADQLQRVAAEFVEDLAADGVVYGEARWAPEQHTQRGLSQAEAVEAIRDGLRIGMERSRAAGRPIEVRQLLTSMRHVEPSTAIAELVLAYRDDSVAGFDIAGAEDGFPADRFRPAFELLKINNVPYTIHAGEAAGPDSILGAVQGCSANRIGHGVRIVEDIDFTGSEPVLGRLAGYVRDWRIPLELCPSSNVQTGAAASIAGHPIKALDELGFTITVNSDNQLMSGTTLSRELALLAEAFDYGLDDLLRLTLNAASVTFLNADQRRQLVDEVIIPGYRDHGLAG